MESASSKQLFAPVLIVLAICSYMNSSSAAASNKLSSDFIAISVALPSSRSTHNAQINEKASMASDFPSQRRRLPRGYYGPSRPNRGTYIPAFASTLKNHKGAPSSISVLTSASENYKAAPSSISAFTSASENHKAAPSSISVLTSASENYKAAPSSISAFTSASENYKAAPSSVSFA